MFHANITRFGYSEIGHFPFINQMQFILVGYVKCSERIVLGHTRQCKERGAGRALSTKKKRGVGGGGGKEWYR